jgi:haloacetate dehalogenase
VLARRFTVVCPDLRGYGSSSKPPVSADHAAYAKRAMAADMLALMRGLGHERFQVVSHDRGARVAHASRSTRRRRWTRLCVMDIVPTLHHFERTDMAFALGYYHWFFLAQPHPKPERMILRDVEDWFDQQTSASRRTTASSTRRRAPTTSPPCTRPARWTAICEDYRAAATIDLGA